MSVAELRKQIDRTDEELVRLLNERARRAVEIGHEKRRGGAPVVDPVREDEVLKRVQKLSRGPLSATAIESIYRRILEACARIQSEE